MARTCSLDELHIGRALEFSMKRFLSFEEYQRKFATVVGLKTVTPAT